MIELNLKKKPTELDEAISRVMNDMASHDLDTEEYKQDMTYLERLTNLKASNSPRRVSPDAIVTAAGSLLGILIIVAYEQRHVMTSKGLSFILKP